MDQTNQVAPQGQGSFGKTLIWVVIAVIIAAAAYFLFVQKSEAPTGPAADQINQQDTTVAIQGQLDSINTGSLDADLKTIDDQLKSL